MTLLDVQARLAGLGVPVLMPEERELPLAGRQPGQAGGLSGYLAAHPGGYVQLSDADGAYTSTVRDIGLMPLTVLAPTRDSADALAAQVTALLHGTTARPTPYQLFSGARHEYLPGIGFSLLLLFQTTHLIPQGAP